MKLVIVESPTKAKTISKFLGGKFMVKSSYGHVRDLPTKKMGIDIKHDFEPVYEIPTKNIDRVAELKKLAKKANGVILATDEDREGEAISWHLVASLGLKIDEIERIVFHEITERAIKEALANPRAINYSLVDAQQARRVLDRLVGYELSPFLWSKIRRGLSAGRVQSVCLRLVVEKEREIQNFKPEEYWAISAQLKNKAKKGATFEAKVSKENGTALGKMGVKNKKHADKITTFLEKADYQISKITKKEVQKNPLAPYTTSTLQQDANNKLGYSSKQTMMLAQQLYEGINIGKEGSVGLITYMRTDSVNLSMESMLTAQKIIAKKFGKEYALENPKFYKTKSKGAQEAHEAIRPTFPEKDPESLKEFLDPKQYKVYAMIWQRMIASQMASAIMNSVAVDIQATQEKIEDHYTLRANGSTIKFDGYLKVYPARNATSLAKIQKTINSAELSKESTSQTQHSIAGGGEKIPVSENLLPELAEKDILDLIKILSEQKFTQPPARFSEAALIKSMEDLGIGRPSTYAPTISTIIDRKYVNKDENKRLFPEEIGFTVCDLLTEHFADIMDYKFTATMEENLDAIAEGTKEWVPVIRDFYKPFHKNLEKKTKEIKKEDLQEKLDRQCPDCGGDLIMKFGRFGKFIACTNYPSCKFTEKTDSEKKVDEEHAGEICDVCGAPMVVKRGRFGTFLGCSNYPECKGIKRIENKTGITCPKCQLGEIVERKSKKGRTFFGCNTYPKCDFALWNKPTGDKCPKCSSLIVFAAKGKTSCSNKECGKTFVSQNKE